MKDLSISEWILVFMIIAFILDVAITALSYNPPMADEGNPESKNLLINYGILGYIMASLFGLSLILLLGRIFESVRLKLLTDAMFLYLGVVHSYGFLTWIIR